ncbi:MAG: hypothetical protein LQ340_007232, partial [Diploschistes diacapsis]
MDAEAEEKLLAQNLLSAARRRDVAATRNLLRKASANVQDAATGFTPLHAAVQGSEDGPATTIASSGAKPGDRSEDDERPVLEIVQLLFENGAIWNDLDGNGETPGCIAWRLGYRRVYRAIVDAGVRAELLLSKLDELDADADTDEDADGGGGSDEHDGSGDDGAAAAPPKDSVSADAGPKRAPETNEGAGAAAPAARSEPASDYIDHWSSNAAFLRSTLRYGATQLLDSSSNAVMMSWETEIMARHAALLLPAPGLAVMNIGHGMGIVDAALQSHRPARHHIVEAHADVLARMRAEGWYERPGVVVHEGRWQEVLPRLLTQGAVELDAVYYDT